jgi:hypothetical protein
VLGRRLGSGTPLAGGPLATLPTVSASGGIGRRLAGVAWVTAALVLPAAAVAAVYLRLYAAHRFAFPVGYDTPKYLWRAALAGAKGIEALSGAAPSPLRSNPDRAGFPVLMDAMSSLLGVSVTRLTIVLPGVMAAAIGLGAAGFARVALRLPLWAMPIFVVCVGASANVSRIAGPGYLDNLLVTDLAMAAATVAMSAATVAMSAADGIEGWRAAAIAGALLLTAGVFTHWIFVALLGVILVATMLVALPRSVGSWRRGERLLATPSGTLAGVTGGAALLGGVGLLTLVGSEPRPPRLPGQAFRSKLADDVPRYVFAVTAALAALGAAFAVRGAVLGRRRRIGPGGTPDASETATRAGGAATETPGGEAAPGSEGVVTVAGVPLATWFVLLWALTAAGGVLLLVLGAAVPAHRFLAFDLGIPLLIAIGIVGVAGLVASRGGALRVTGAVLVAIAYRAWSGAHPWIPSKQFSQAAVAGTYLERVGGTAPVVFIVDLHGASPLASTTLAFHVIRTALAPGDIRRTLEYLGTPENFLAGRPTLRAQPLTFNQASMQHWPSVRAVLDQRPTALLLSAFNRGFAQVVAAHPDWRIAPGVLVVQGPRPPGPYAPRAAVPAPLPGAALAALWVAFLAVLSLAGGGWAATAVRSGPGAAALAPAFGIAGIVLTGIVADRLGVRLAGAGGTALIATVAAAGWALFALSRVWAHAGRSA